MERPTVLLVAIQDPTPYATALMRAGFEVIHGLGQAAELRSSGVRPDVAVMDADADPMTIDRAHAMLRSDPAVPTILLVSDDLRGVEHLDLESDEIALKPMPSDTLVYRVQAMLIRAGHHEAAAEQDGGSLNASGDMVGAARVISVFAPKGGVGKTTLAVNLAVAIRQQTRASVLLIDADAGVGNVTALINVPLSRGLVDLADSAPAEWTSAAFGRLVTAHPDSGVEVLGWGLEPGDAERVSTDMLLAAARWGRQHYSYVIIDTHPDYDDRSMAMLTVATEILLVVTPEIGPVRNGSQFIALAKEVGLGDLIRVVANRANHGIGVQQVAEALGLPVSATVVSAGRHAVLAANEGRPLVLRYPHERIANDIHALARQIAHGEETRRPEARRRWWQVLTMERAQA